MAELKRKMTNLKPIDKSTTHVLCERSVQEGKVEERFCILYNGMTECEVGTYEDLKRLYDDIGLALTLCSKEYENFNKE